MAVRFVCVWTVGKHAAKGGLIARYIGTNSITAASVCV